MDKQKERKTDGMLDVGRDGKIIDMKVGIRQYLQEIKETGQRPSTVIYSKKNRFIVLLKLAAQLKGKIEECRQIKLAKYEALTKHLTSRDFRSTVLVTEIGARAW